MAGHQGHDLEELGQAISIQLSHVSHTGLTVVAAATLIQLMLQFVEIAGPWLRAARKRRDTAA